MPAGKAETIFEINDLNIETNITRAVEEVGSAVVTVVSTTPGPMRMNSQLPSQQSSGSGVIVSTDGYILTNNHVIENAEEVSIVLADGTTLPAEVKGADRFVDLIW